jgi:preprotein translocase subunit SecA
MIKALFESVFGSSSSRRLKKLKPILERINALEAGVRALPDSAFPEKTAELKARLAEIISASPVPEGDEDERRKAEKELWQNALAEVLPEAFALVREAARRAIGLRHYDVQFLGGLVLHEGGIAEMKTGEGKTLVATAPVYLNALLGRGVHLVTVNDYLAKRDAEWMGPVYRFLGLTVGFVQHDLPNEERRAAYASDVTYVTNNEVGFATSATTWLRAEDRVLRPVHYAIVDEVDSILVDEARTPLIISGAAEKSTDRYAIINRIIPLFNVRKITEEDEIQAKYKGEDLGKGFDAIVDEKNHTAVLTEDGVQKRKSSSASQPLRRLEGEWSTTPQPPPPLYHRDVEYVVRTARSSSSTSSPGASCPAGAGPTASIRPWRPRRISPPGRRTRPSPRSPSRTSSSSTGRWAA